MSGNKPNRNRPSETLFFRRPAGKAAPIPSSRLSDGLHAQPPYPP
ncbi:hypothetical protein [Neisseria elongata]|nr:hypothetical protein [Neisseria elongata]